MLCFVQFIYFLNPSSVEKLGWVEGWLQLMSAVNKLSCLEHKMPHNTQEQATVRRDKFGANQFAYSWCS